MATRKRKVSQKKHSVRAGHEIHVQGRFFDLQYIFKRLNRRYFHNALRGYTITWGRRRKQRPKEYFIFGSIQEETRVIRIHPLLDQAFVPVWFLEYVVYHEMLHSVVPDQFDPKGRRLIHHGAFNRREQLFPHYRRAKRWEEQNLDRFLR